MAVHHGPGCGCDECRALLDAAHQAIAGRPLPACTGGSDTACDDCGAECLSPAIGHPTEWYMVTDDVWETARAPETIILCIGCLETRLGRTLTRADFTDAPLNDLTLYNPERAWWHRTARLTDRLREEPAP